MRVTECYSKSQCGFPVPTGETSHAIRRHLVSSRKLLHVPGFAEVSEEDKQTDRQTDRYFYCQRHSTCEEMHLKATNPSTLYSYVTNGLDIECQNQKGHLLQYCHN